MTGRERVFVDSNVALYLIGPDQRKAEIAEEIFRSNSFERVISTQVVAEFVNTARRKSKLPWSEVRRDAWHIRELCIVQLITNEIIDAAMDLGENHQFGWHDSLIVACALSAGARRLLTEDLQHRQVVEGLKIVNPFRDE